jgi:formiminotetrahydrofolate cyclodeaminase
VESLTEYLERLASAAPTPGGGSAATIVAAIAAALVSMAARITVENPNYAQRAERAQRIVDRADALRSALLEASRRDEEAFEAVMASRGDARQAALKHAADEPLGAMRLALDVQRLAEETLELGNRHLASDLGVACELAAAGLTSSAYNVRVNHRTLRDADAVNTQSAEMETLERESANVLRRVRETAR